MATDNKSKNKKNRYRPNNKSVKKGAYPLCPGVQGFHITCDGGRERQASQEAVNVIDTFYEELVQGIVPKLGQGELSGNPSNKKIVFTYSDSSGSDDDDEGEEDNGKGDNQTKKETEKIEQNQEKADAEIGSLTSGGSGPENKDIVSTDEQIQGNTEKKEEPETTHEHQEVEEPPAKKQCVQKDAPEIVKVACGKTEEISVDKLIEAELAELGDKSKRRFSYLDSGCNGVVFVQMRMRDGDPSPKDIVQHMMSSLALTKRHVSRFILRVLPIELTCYASEEEIGKSIKPIIAKYFPAETDTPKKFAVLYEARANTGINRMNIINTVAKCVPSPHKVDLSNPEINIVVEIVKTVCLLGVVEKYKELSKYNLRQLTSK